MKKRHEACRHTLMSPNFVAMQQEYGVVNFKLSSCFTEMKTRYAKNALLFMLRRT